MQEVKKTDNKNTNKEMSKCKDCHKEVVCDNPQFAECVIYEGFVSPNSPLEGKCALNVRMVLEDLYSVYGSEGHQYFAGEGLELNGNTFSVLFGTIQGTVMEGNWRPTWNDVTGKPQIPEQVNIIGGDNVTVTGSYPNIVINAEVPSSSISLTGGDNISITSVGENYTITYVPYNFNTGDVQGTTTLNIQQGVVSNSKLSNMPSNTLKGRVGSSGEPMDLTPQQVKDVVGLNQQTLVTTSAQTQYTVTLDRELTTGVFLARETKEVTIPDGQFEGQYVHTSAAQSAGVTLYGKFIDWTQGNTNVTTFLTFTDRADLFWSVSRGAWLTTKS